MPYRLIVTRPDGTRFHSETAPLETLEEVGLSALKTLTSQGVSYGREGLLFGQSVRDTPIGHTARHHPSGFTFRPEHF